MVEPATVATAISTVITEETQDGTKSSSANKNGRKGESGSGSGSFFTWFMVLALLGVWTSVAVVYFDLVDYQGVLGKLVAYDTDGDGDFDVEDAKVLLDEPGGSVRRAPKDPHPTKDVGLKLREALKQQLALIHERVEAKKLAKMALAEVRLLLEKEEEQKELDVGRKEISARVKERVAARLREEEEKMEQEEMERLRKEKEKPPEEEKEEKQEEVKEEVEEPKAKRKRIKAERRDRN